MLVAFESNPPDVLARVVDGDDYQRGLASLQKVAHATEVILGMLCQKCPTIPPAPVPMRAAAPPGVRQPIGHR